VTADLTLVAPLSITFMSTHELFYKNATNIVGKLQEIDVFFSDHDYKFTGVIETLLRGEGYS